MRYLSKPRRVELLDEIRGLCILLMVLYHGAYDLVYLFDVNIPVFHWPILAYAQPFVAGVFIFISGIACRYSRSNLKRGCIALGLGIAVSMVTWFFMRDQMIWFGILHCLGSCMMLFSLLRPLLDKLSVVAGILCCAALFVLTLGVQRGALGLPGVAELGLPLSLYDLPWLMPLGIGGSGADYFPLIPWMFVFFAGAYLGVPFEQGDMPQAVYRSHSRPLAKIGRHTLLVYVVHQPLVYGLLWVVFWALRRAGLQ